MMSRRRSGYFCETVAPAPDFSSTMMTSVRVVDVGGAPPCFSGPFAKISEPAFALAESFRRTTTLDGCSCSTDRSPGEERK